MADERNTASEIYAQRLHEGNQRKAERLKMELELRKAYDANSPRYMRAQRSATQICATLDDFIPRKCREDAYEEMLLALFSVDCVLAEVPPEFDALQGAALKAEIAKHMLKPYIVMPKE